MTKMQLNELFAIYPSFQEDFYNNFYEWGVQSLELQRRIDPSSSKFDAKVTYQKLLPDFFPYIEGFDHFNYVQKKFSNMFFDHICDWEKEYASKMPKLFSAKRIAESRPLPSHFRTPNRKVTSIVNNFIEQEPELNISENTITEEITQEETPNIVQLPGLVPGKEFNIHIHVSAPLTVEYHENGLIIS